MKKIGFKIMISLLTSTFYISSMIFAQNVSGFQSNIDRIFESNNEKDKTKYLYEFYSLIDKAILEKLQTSGTSAYNDIQCFLLTIKNLKPDIFLPKYSFLPIKCCSEEVYATIYQVEGYTSPCAVHFFRKRDDGNYEIFWKSEDDPNLSDIISPYVIITVINCNNNELLFYLTCSDTANGQYRQTLLLMSLNINTGKFIIKKSFLSRISLSNNFNYSRNELIFYYRTLVNTENPSLNKSYIWEKHIINIVNMEEKVFKFGHELPKSELIFHYKGNSHDDLILCE